MTECKEDRGEFSSTVTWSGRRRVEACFDGGRITSDAGAVLLREADRRLGLSGRLAAGIEDPRNPVLITHHMQTMIAQRVCGIALGYEDLNDHQALRDDLLMQLLGDVEDPMASPPTLCRMEKRINRRSLWRMAAVLVDVFIESFGGATPQELVLDFDATDDAVHGKQEGRAFNAYYDQYCFLPLYVFCGGQPVAAYLRPSNIDASRHAWAILALLVKRLRSKWPMVRIVVRADSGFCRWRMLRWCDRHGVDYIIGVAKNSRLLDAARPLMERAAAAWARTQETQRLFGDLGYAAQTWDKERRVIVKAEHMRQGENPRFVVTSLAGDARHLYEDVYCARGEMENRIKEQQLGLFADRTSCRRFQSNQLRVLLSAAAYVLVEHIRRVALAGTRLAQAQVTRIRLELFKIGARIVRSARRVVLHVCSSYPWQDVFWHARARLMAPN
jgi:hypothetical protein